MRLVAEYVGPGHPDRLCDQIVESIVDDVVSHDKDALVGLECAVHTNKVFIDGRIAAGKDKVVISHKDIEEIVKSIYRNTGHEDFSPYVKDLKIIQDVCIETLSDEERNIRKYSDDQNIVTGYAVNNKETKYLPLEQYLALELGNSLRYSLLEYKKILGQDFKLLVDIEYDGKAYCWNRLTLSIHHKKDINFSNIFEITKKIIDQKLDNLFRYSYPSLANITNDKFILNGAGDFIQGGPEGDNGLSGKKLVIDFYGPNIPIGGGAICGKDWHKVDVCGALRARHLAVRLIETYGFYSVFTRLGWSPGDSSPNIIEAYSIDEFGTKTEIDRKLLPASDWFSIECIVKELSLDHKKLLLVRNGYMSFIH